jgi:hypothetical protein
MHKQLDASKEIGLDENSEEIKCSCPATRVQKKIIIQRQLIST